MLASYVGFSQKKSKSDPKDLQIDSLKQTSQKLSVQLDSISNELVKYLGLYDAVKEKILHYNFDPAKAAQLIDSLKVVRDSTSAMLFTSANTTRKSDSIAMLLKENTSLKANQDSLQTAWKKDKDAMDTEEINTLKAIGGLKHLKELLDEKIITETEFIALKKKYLDKL